VTRLLAWAWDQLPVPAQNAIWSLSPALGSRLDDLAGRYDAVCVEEWCTRTATRERFEDVTSDGTPIVELVCRRHGGVKR
jgi:hypothetical protein